MSIQFPAGPAAVSGRKSVVMLAALLGLVLLAPSRAADALTRANKVSSQPCAVPAPAPAAAPSGLTLSGSLPLTGCIQLAVSGAVATPVTITELVAGEPASVPVATVVPQNGAGALAAGLPWSCSRTSRTFQATETAPDGSQQTSTVTVKTPNCAGRLTVSIPATRLHRGYPLLLAVRDRWHLGGLTVRVCQPGTPRGACPALLLKPGRVASVLRIRLLRAGTPVLTIYDEYQRIRRRLRVFDSVPLLLATGDSEMQVLDELIGSDLGGRDGVRVVGDAKQSTAISSPFFFNWPAHAVAQVNDTHPDIVAMFLGGNEGFRLGNAECCGADWSREYANRVAGMMRVYLQGGVAAVYWFLIPTPRSEPFVRVMRAVNWGIEMAAARFKHGVHVFDLRQVFSPGGRYLSSMGYGRSTITVHESDGFHLSASADVIVAHMFVARLRRDGLIP